MTAGPRMTGLRPGQQDSAVLDLATLNAPQRQAVTTTEGPLLVLAGAGSGKTRVIAHRVAYLLVRGVRPASILAVTFTNRAAEEMRERIRRLVSGAGLRPARRAEPDEPPPAPGGEVFVATFHAFGLCFLQREHEAAGLPRRFGICDAGDQLAIVKRCLREVHVDDRAFDARRVLFLISGAKNARRKRLQVRPEGQGDDYDLVAAEVYPRYEAALRAQRAVDFDDLIARPVELLERDASLQGRWQRVFSHLLVDEYQDTNACQLALLKLLAGDRRNVCAVGDDDQAIYGWRGAEVRNILRFDWHFPGAVEVRLEQNYRSTGHILACANGVIGKNPHRKPKRLWTASGDGEPVTVAPLEDDEAEARFVADAVVRLRHEGTAPSEVAVLYRLNAQSRPVEEALREVGVAYQIRGAAAFFDRTEVRDLLAYLKVCAEPEDEISLARIVNVPARGLGDASLERAHAFVQERKLPLLHALRRAGEIPDLPHGAAERMRGFVALVDRYARAFEARPIAEVARELVAEVDLYGHVRAGVKSADAARRRVDALAALLRSIEGWAARTSRRPTLRNYLAKLALDTREEEPAGGEGVTLMSLHAAKGLEFPVVFLVGVEEDLLPCAGIQGEARDLEEERRLAYVGITRARRKLYLTHAVARLKRGRVETRTPSRFLQDLPAPSWVLHDPSRSPDAPERVAERSAEVLAALRARLGRGR